MITKAWNRNGEGNRQWLESTRAPWVGETASNVLKYSRRTVSDY